MTIPTHREKGTMSLLQPMPKKEAEYNDVTMKHFDNMQHKKIKRGCKISP